MNNSVTCLSCKHGKYKHKRATQQQTIFVCWKTGEGKERLSWQKICPDFEPKNKAVITSYRNVRIESKSGNNTIESYLL